VADNEEYIFLYAQMPESNREDLNFKEIKTLFYLFEVFCKPHKLIVYKVYINT